MHEPARPRPHRSLDSPGLQELCATGPCHPSACKLHQAAEGSRATSSCILPDAIRLSSASAFDTTQGSCSKMHLTSTRGSNASLRTVTNADFCLALGLSRLVMPQRVKQNLETIVDRGLVPEIHFLLCRLEEIAKPTARFVLPTANYRACYKLQFPHLGGSPLNQSYISIIRQMFFTIVSHYF